MNTAPITQPVRIQILLIDPQVTFTVLPNNLSECSRQRQCRSVQSGDENRVCASPVQHR